MYWRSVTWIVKRDTLVFGAAPEEHDKRLLTALNHLKDDGMVLNKKCSVWQPFISVATASSVQKVFFLSRQCCYSEHATS